MSLIKPCALTLAPNNTGYDCTARMSATSLFIMVPLTAKWQASDEEDFLAYIQKQIHEVPSKRWYPFFGLQAPIRTITDAKETDVTVTYDDGSIAFIRNGTFTRTYATNTGGLKFAQALLSFNKFKKYGFIEVDKDNNVLRRKNDDGTYSGLHLNAAYAPAPDLATLTTEFKPAFTLNFTLDEYISKSELATSDNQDLRDLMGLIDSETVDAGNSTATTLRVKVRTIGTQTDLLALFPTLLTVGNFAVKDASGATVTVTAVAASATPAADGSVIAELTVASQTSGAKLTVSVVDAKTLFAANIEGYDVITPAVITIP